MPDAMCLALVQRAPFGGRQRVVKGFAYQHVLEAQSAACVGFEESRGERGRELSEQTRLVTTRGLGEHGGLETAAQHRRHA